MKQLITLIGALLVSSFCFANTPNSTLDALGSAWKNQQQSNHSQQIQNDITMVYGGEDVARRANLDTPSFIS